jgi:hypothetical protein
MASMRTWILLGGCLGVMTVAVWAQNRKPGLWEITSAQEGSGGTPTHAQVCLTQQDIDAYGAPFPQMRGCKVTNLVKKANGMTGEMVCSGAMSGKMSLESMTTDSEHAKGKIHFVGSVQNGLKSQPVEWTIVSTSVFKGPVCGAVKSMPPPGK